MGLLKSAIDQWALESQGRPKTPAEIAANVKVAEDATEELEFLCLTMESAVKSGKGYSSLELAQFDTAVADHFKRLDLQPPLSLSRKLNAVHDTEAGSQLNLASVESYVEKLRGIVSEVRVAYQVNCKQTDAGTSR